MGAALARKKEERKGERRGEERRGCSVLLSFSVWLASFLVGWFVARLSGGVLLASLGWLVFRPRLFALAGVGWSLLLLVVFFAVGRLGVRGGCWWLGFPAPRVVAPSLF